MEEIRKILKMLEEGKITAEEAERLIEAIEEKKEKRKSSGFIGIGEIIKDSVGSAFSFIPEIIGSSLSLAFSPDKVQVKENIDWDKEIPLILQVTGGDVDISINEENFLFIEGEGVYQRVENGIKIMGDFNLKIPPLKKIAIEMKAGDLDGKIKAEDFKLELQAGDADLNLTAKNIEVSLKMGDLDITLENIPENAEIDCKMGDVTLKLPEDFDGTIFESVTFGNFSVEKDYKIKGRNYIIGSGEKCKMNISCKMGNVKII